MCNFSGLLRDSNSDVDICIIMNRICYGTRKMSTVYPVRRQEGHAGSVPDVVPNRARACSRPGKRNSPERGSMARMKVARIVCWLKFATSMLKVRDEPF